MFLFNWRPHKCDILIFTELPQSAPNLFCSVHTFSHTFVRSEFCKTQFGIIFSMQHFLMQTISFSHSVTNRWIDLCLSEVLFVDLFAYILLISSRVGRQWEPRQSCSFLCLVVPRTEPDGR